METQEYEGWTNRETWATMLHIDNDEGLSELALYYARQELDGLDDGEEVNVYHFSETIKSWIEDELLTFENIAQGNHGLWLMLTDIGSLYRVNWREIAESLLENAKVNA